MANNWIMVEPKGWTDGWLVGWLVGWKKWLAFVKIICGGNADCITHRMANMLPVHNVRFDYDDDGDDRDDDNDDDGLLTMQNDNNSLNKDAN